MRAIAAPCASGGASDLPGLEHPRRCICDEPVDVPEAAIDRVAVARAERAITGNYVDCATGPAAGWPSPASRSS